MDPTQSSTQSKVNLISAPNPGSIGDTSNQQQDEEMLIQPPKIEDLPLEKKLQILQKFNYLDFYKLDHYIDAQDSVSQWCLGQIVAQDGKNIQVHFDGWSNKWDLWQKIISFKVAPFRKYSRGYTGQIKVALRQSLAFNLEDLQEVKNGMQKCIDLDFSHLSAHEVTQYLRGQLYIYIDFLMQGGPYAEDQIDAINDIIYCYLRLVVSWLKKLQTLIPLWGQIKFNSDLFLIDSNIALLLSSYEIMDTLRKIFGSCHRCIKYYFENDKEHIKFDHPVTTEQYNHKNFSKNRKRDEDALDVDEIKKIVQFGKGIVFGQMMNFLDYFSELHGFEAIVDYLRLSSETSEEKIPFDQFTIFTFAFRNCADIFAPTFSQNFVNQIKGIFLQRIQTMNEKELKEVDKESIGRVLNELKDFFQLALTDTETYELIEKNQLQVALRFLKSTYLEKRLKGIHDIKFLLDRLENAQMIQSRNHQTNMRFKQISMNDELIGSRGIKPAKWITVEIMKDWIIDEKILDIVLGENTHLEIVKRSSCILKFMAKQGHLPIDSVDLIWKSQLGKHEEQVRVVYQLIQDLVPSIPGQYIDLFFNRISEVPVSQYDVKFLEFLKDFTIKSLESSYDHRHNEDSISETQPLHYGQIISQREVSVLQQIGEIVLNAQAAQIGDENHYGLPIFWELIQDKTPQISQEITQLSISSLSEILGCNFSHPIRISYLIKAMDNLVKGESIVQSITIAQRIIKDFQQQSYDENSISQRNVIIQLNKQLDLVNRIIENIKNYHLQVKDKVKSLTNQKKQLPEDVSNYVFVGKNTHETILTKLLRFLEFIIIDSSLDVSLGCENITTLWQLFVLQPNFQSDQNLFLKWINELDTKRSENYIFTDEERKYLFVQILCNPVSVSEISYAQVKCFQKYFKMINNDEKTIDITRKRMKILNFEGLIGLETLWKMAVESDNQKSREESIDLLVDLHLKFDQSIQVQDLQAIWQKFINTCMNNLQSQDEQLIINTIQLLSKFLDRFEGKKQLHVVQPQFSHIQPLNLLVINRNDQQKRSVSISYYQSFGHLRQKIAEAFDMQINEFIMSVRNQFIDPDEDDNKLIKEMGMIQNVQIVLNNNYNPELHPKYLISGNPNNYDLLFSLLQKNNSKLIDSTWELLQKLPTNEKLKQEIKDLQGLTKGSKNWEKILDPSSTNKLLYSLKIIKTQHLSQKDQKQTQWLFKFVQLGGFDHLLRTFINLNVTQQIDTNLTLKCIELLIYTLHDFIKNDETLINLVLERKEDVVYKTVNLIDLIVDYLIQNDQKRGYSIEDLQKRINQNKQKKNKLKSYNLLNSKGKDNQQQQQNSMQQEEEEDKESQEYTQHQLLQKTFQEDSQIVDLLMKFMFFAFMTKDTSFVSIIARYPSLESLLTKATIASENHLLRTQILNRFKEIIILRVNSPEELVSQLQILGMLMFKIQAFTEKYEQRCFNFFEILSSIIEAISLQNLQQIQPDCIKLIEELSHFIQSREIKEKNTQDCDFLLLGKNKLLRSLLKKFPHTKRIIGQTLTQHLLHDCLFQVPQGGSSKNQNTLPAPKCKGQLSRKVAVNLLSVLCRDCVENLQIVLEYMAKFNSNPSWRTNKDHDWNISLMDSEKSSTGYVGLKNLGCICYMNSLFQQLFMIKSFRNDLLCVKDPSADKVQKEENMLYQLQLLFTGLLKSEKQFVSPKGFCHAFKDWDGNPTNVMEQMDVEEFFNMIMDRIETAIKSTPQQNTIQEHFGGKFASEMICKGCPHRYERSEPFLSISIPVKNKKSILEGLQAFIQGDMLEGDNSYMCEKCDKKVDALKRTCVKKMPKHLIVALRRFEFDYDKMIRVKINDYCEFPTDLDLEPYTQEGLARREKFQKQKEERGEDSQDAALEMDPLKYPKEYYEYSLTGIVVHSGTADSGHYYSFIKDQEHPESGKWYELNDHIVRDFDPNDLAQETYGGEETFQGYNMMQMKSMKWRNAYLLFYERKIPEDIESDEEKESEKSKSTSREDVEMKNVSQNQELDILSEIEDKIAYENIKYWQNRFLFGNEYHDFVLDLSMHWNTSCIIPREFLTKNNDFVLTGYPMPLNYDKDTTPNLDLTDQKLPIKPEDAIIMEEKVFQFAAQFYITISQRTANKTNIPAMVNLLKAYINKNANCASWLLEQFCNDKILEEILFQCGSKEMRKFIVGLLYCALLKLYPKERNNIIQYWTNPMDPANIKSVITNLSLVLIKNIFKAKDFLANSAQFFQLIARLTSLGPEIREFMLKARLVGRLMDFYYDNLSPHKAIFRDMADINPIIVSKPSIGLPTDIDKKQLSQFQEMLEKRRMKQLQEGPLKYKYLLESVGNCIRAFKNGSLPSPYYLDKDDSVQVENILGLERDLYIPEARFLMRVFESSRKNRSIKNACMSYLHFTWQEIQGFQEIISVIQQGLNNSDYLEVRPFLILTQFILQNPGGDKIAERFETVLEVFLDTVKLNSGYYKFMEVMYEYIFKWTSRIPLVKEWFVRNKPKWTWLIDWNQETKYPINNGDQNVSLYKRKSNMMHQNNQHLRIEYVKYLANKEVRSNRLEQLIRNQVPDLSGEIDIDLVDMQDYKFVHGEVFEQYNRKFDKFKIAQVENVLDEMIYVKYLDSNTNTNQDGMYQNQNTHSWIGKDSDKILPANTIATLYKTRIFSHFLSQQNLKLNQNSAQNNSSQSQRRGGVQGGQGSYRGQAQDVFNEDYDMNDGAVGGGASNINLGESEEENDESDDQHSIN